MNRYKKTKSNDELFDDYSLQIVSKYAQLSQNLEFLFYQVYQQDCREPLDDKHPRICKFLFLSRLNISPSLKLLFFHKEVTLGVEKRNY
jgi:hypothetical protein